MRWVVRSWFDGDWVGRLVVVVFEVMARLVGRPERDNGLQRRAARQHAGKLCDHHRLFRHQLEARTRPRFDAIQRDELVGTFFEGAQHGVDLFSNQAKKMHLCVDRNST